MKQVLVESYRSCSGCLSKATAAHMITVSGSRREALHRLVAEGCCMTEVACTYAAMGVHLEVLQWLRARGCPWDEHVLISAVTNGFVKVAGWAV